MDALDRALAKLDVGLCWGWTGATFTSGYGQFAVDGRHVQPHRWLYEQLVGPVPAGLELDHLCRNKLCCNTDHLEPVTHRENMRRAAIGVILSAAARAKTHCPSGHAYDQENTRLGSRGERRCRACNRERARARRARKRTESSEPEA